ncbi:MAG: hypothetical protein ACRC2S_10500 [Waterburya sp.]
MEFTEDELKLIFNAVGIVGSSHSQDLSNLKAQIRLDKNFFFSKLDSLDTTLYYVQACASIRNKIASGLLSEQLTENEVDAVSKCFEAAKEHREEFDAIIKSYEKRSRE